MSYKKIFNKYIGLIVLVTVFFLGGCKTQKTFQLNTEDYSTHTLEEVFEHSKALNNHLTGFALFDLQKDQFTFRHNGQKFFTPASNTKLLTLYTAMNYLPDSIPWMNVYQDSVGSIYEPLGDPSFLHPDLNTPERIKSYFQSNHMAGDTIRLSIAHFRSEIFGSGWSWDDYYYGYQPEISPFPIHGNVIETDTVLVNGDPLYLPHWLDVDLVLDTLAPESQFREKDRNTFRINSIERKHRIPIRIDTSFYEAYFKDLGFELRIVDVWDLGYGAEKATIHSIPSDTLYKLFIEESDNLVGEHLLLQCAMQRYGVMNTDIIIGYALNDILDSIKDELNWVDGSGLSRYNLVSPNAMAWLIRQLVSKSGLNRLIHILPAGGKEGTISEWYDYDPPRVFAKTGTLRYCHNLSGLLQAESGKWYVFSFMHNNFNSGSAPIKKEMQKVLDVIIKKY